MSAFNLIKKPISEIREFLAVHSAELRETKIPNNPNTYLIKFNSTTKVGHPDINPLRGLLFNSVTGKVYSMTYPVPIEMKDLPVEEQKPIVEDLMKSEYQVQEALDGTLLRLAYIDETTGWLLSTNGKANAKEAFWMNGVSFGEHFWSANPKIKLEDLNKEYVYMFLLCHPLNVIVVNHTEPQIYHMATYDRQTLREVESDLGINKPSVIPFTVEVIQKLIAEANDKPVASAGFMVVKKADAEGVVKRYRFENLNYTKARELRGDSNNTNYHILGLMLDKDQTKLAEFLEYYPLYHHDVEELHTRLAALVAKFYREYGLRFKGHSAIFINQRHHKFLMEIHAKLYLGKLKGEGKTVQYQDIMDYVKDQPTAKVLYLLNYIFDDAPKAV
jgi:hypothetical protein